MAKNKTRKTQYKEENKYTLLSVHYVFKYLAFVLDFAFVQNSKDQYKLFSQH